MSFRVWLTYKRKKEEFCDLLGAKDQFQGTLRAQDKVGPSYLAIYSHFFSFFLAFLSFNNKLLQQKRVGSHAAFNLLRASPPESESKPLVYTLHANGMDEGGLPNIYTYIHIYIEYVYIVHFALKTGALEPFVWWLLNIQLQLPALQAK